MTTRANLANAVQLSQELDMVNAALAIVNANNFQAVIEIKAADGSTAAFRFNTNIPQATLLNQLTARQTALQTALTNLGVV